MLDKGWRRSVSDPDVLVHPRDHDMFVRYDPATDTPRASPALAAGLELVIPTPAIKSRIFRR